MSSFLHPVHDVAKLHMPLKEWVDLAREFVRLDRILQVNVPSGLVGACRAVCVRDDALIIFAYHSAAAAKLRALERQLMQKFSARGYEFSCITVLVRSRFERIVPTCPPTPMSAVARTCLREGAMRIEHEGLRAAMLRLANDER